VQTRAGVVIASGPNYNFKPANGDWRNVAAEFPDLQPGDRIRVIVGSSNMNPGTWRIWVDDVTTGAAEAIPVPGRRHWEIVSQNVVDDIRAHGDATHLIIPTYNWASTSVHLYHPNGPWIVDPLNNFRYDSHVYFDGSSGYGHPYSYYNDNAKLDGFQDSLAPRLADLYDVRIVNPQDGQRLVYDAATGYWKNG